MKALTVRQPHAQLIALGVQTIYTSPRTTKYRGPLLIHAGKHEPAHVNEVPLSSEGAELYDALAKASGREDYGWLPLGAIVGSCNLVDVVPIGGPYDFSSGLVEGEAPATAGKAVIVHYPKFAGWPELLVLDRWQGRQEVITDQLPYGDFTPGRYAWLLEDVQPVEKRCPACWGAGTTAPLADQIRGVFRAAPFGPQGTGIPACPVCQGKGYTDPIPAKGKQGIWEWSP